jgi:hypothetical protein
MHMWWMNFSHQLAYSYLFILKKKFFKIKICLPQYWNWGEFGFNPHAHFDPHGDQIPILKIKKWRNWKEILIVEMMTRIKLLNVDGQYFGFFGIYF